MQHAGIGRRPLAVSGLQRRRQSHRADTKFQTNFGATFFGTRKPGYGFLRRHGERLPSYYRTRYAPVDYRRHHLRAPPRGYHYVQDDRGEILLVAIVTGLIASIIASR